MSLWVPTRTRQEGPDASPCPTKIDLLTDIPRFILISALVLAQVACVPFPHRRMEKSGIEGRVVDRGTGSPLPGARVSVPGTGRGLSMSDAHGRFTVEPMYRWHAIYQFEFFARVTGQYPERPLPPPPLAISAVGYRTAEFGLVPPSPSDGISTYPLTRP